MEIKVMNNKSLMIGETAFADAGDGSVVVLVHGLGLNQAMWQWQLPALKKGYRVITYDLPYGTNGRPVMSINR
jgi:pimeloyl-ACP methyl ester carboxylesterase